MPAPEMTKAARKMRPIMKATAITANAERSIAVKGRQLQLSRVQREPVKRIALTEPTIVLALTVSHVSDEGA